MIEWFKDFDNVKALGRALVEAGFTGDELQHYYEKPWNWTAEWDALQVIQEALVVTLFKGAKP